MKTIAVISEPISALTSETNRILTPVLIAAEFGLAFLVLAGVYWSVVRRILLLVFSGFACYSLLLAIQGAESCGCFGQLKVNPWWTFALDIFVLLGLGLEILRKGQLRDGKEFSKTTWAKPCLAFGSVLSVGMCTGLLLYLNPIKSSAGVVFQQVGELVILEPEDWVGLSFPLAEHVDVKLNSGEWSVLLHRHDCPKCQETIAKLEAAYGTDQTRQIAIIEVPPYGQSHRDESLNGFSHGRLIDDREWFVQTPVVIRLKDGIIASVSDELPTTHTVSKIPSGGH